MELDMEGEREENAELNELQRAINENTELKLLNNMCEGSIAILDSLPITENELFAYENQTRQDTSKLAQRFKISYWRLDDFPDSFYKSFLQLLDRFEYKERPHNSEKKAPQKMWSKKAYELSVP